MKSYTNLEQSKILPEILPIESADMHYWKRTWKENDYAISVGHSKELQEGFESKCIEYIHCWSLAALFSVLPEGIIENYYAPYLQKEDGKYSIAYGDDELLCIADNPVDACYELILKLKDKNGIFN